MPHKCDVFITSLYEQISLLSQQKLIAALKLKQCPPAPITIWQVPAVSLLQISSSIVKLWIVYSPPKLAPVLTFSPRVYKCAPHAPHLLACFNIINIICHLWIIILAILKRIDKLTSIGIKIWVHAAKSPTQFPCQLSHSVSVDHSNPMSQWRTGLTKISHPHISHIPLSKWRMKRLYAHRRKPRRIRFQDAMDVLQAGNLGISAQLTDWLLEIWILSFAIISLPVSHFTSSSIPPTRQPAGVGEIQDRNASMAGSRQNPMRSLLLVGYLPDFTPRLIFPSP